MTTSSHQSAEFWAPDLVDEGTTPAPVPAASPEWIEAVEPAVDAPRDSPGLSLDEAALPGRLVIVLSVAAVAVAVLLDLLLTGGRITFFFDLCFVVICLAAPLLVRRADLFTAGVLPPLLFAAVIAVLALGTPSSLREGSGLGHVFLAGLASHVVGLVYGYTAALIAVATRVAADGSR